MTLRNRIIFGFIIIILLSYMVVAIVVSLYSNRDFINQVQIRVHHDLLSAHKIYDDYIERVEEILEAVSIRRSMDAPLDEEIEGDLGKVFRNIYQSSGLDMLTLLDNEGRVIYRAHNPGKRGDDISGIPVVKNVMENWEPVSGTVVVPAEMMAREGKEIYGRAGISIIPTPMAMPTTKTKEGRGMFIVAAVPFISLHNNERIGILLGGYLLNRNNKIVDEMKKELFADLVLKDTNAGTVTIFFDDLRISTNVMMESNERAIGSRLSKEVYEHVILDGNVWSDRAFVVNDWYITAYEPLFDVDGQIIGSLYVGVLEAPYKQPQKILIIFILFMLCLTALAAFLLTLFYMKRMMRPIDNVVLTCTQLMKGELNARCRIRPSGEMGLLCRAIDQMADAFEKFEKNLVRETQLQIGQSEKLAAIGRLAAGIAHEINNPLTSILNFAHLVKENKTIDEEAQGDINTIIEETNRVTKIVRELLDFARQSPAKMENIEINQILQQLLALITKQKEFRSIRFIEEYDETLPSLLADKNQLQQVFLNLLLNSAESIVEEGTITVYTRDYGDHCTITINDTGCGIKPEDLDKIFDPFFTTKPVGKGTGLGLSISYGIVKQYGGEIHCESTEDEGSAFSVKLPYQQAEEKNDSI